MRNKWRYIAAPLALVVALGAAGLQPASAQDDQTPAAPAAAPAPVPLPDVPGPEGKLGGIDPLERIDKGEVTEVVVTDTDGKMHVEKVDSSDDAEKLADSPAVKRVEPNETFSSADVDGDVIPLDQADTTANATTGSASLQSSGLTGAGEVVAILDGGFDQAVSGFSGRIIAEACISQGGYCGATSMTGSATVYDASNPYTAPGAADAYPSSCGGYTHGTQVASIAAGGTTLGTRTGAAPGADIVLVRVGNCGNTTTTFNLAQALAWVNNEIIVNRGIRVSAANISYSSSPPTTTAVDCDASQATLKGAIDGLRTNLALTVIASGNGSSAVAAGVPSCITTAVSVSAQDGAAAASFTDLAPYTDTIAPGVNLSAQTVGGGFAVGSGSSFAAPQVAGIAAQIRQQNNVATGRQMHDAIRAAGPILRDLRPGPPGYGLAVRQMYAPDVLTKVNELTSIVAGKYNAVKPTRAVDSFGNFRGVGVNSGTDMTVNLADAMGVSPTDIGSVVAIVTIFGDACLSVMSPRPTGTTYTGAAGTISQSGIVSNRQVLIPNAAGFVDFRMSGGCTAGPYQFNIDVVGFFGGSADLNEINPVRVVNGAVLGANVTNTYTVTGGSIPSNATGVVGMLTVQQAGALSFHDIGPASTTLGSAAPMTAPAGVMRDNLVWTSLSSGQIKLWNLQGTATMYFDVYGYTLSGSTSVVMLDPNRTYDSRGVGTVSTSVSRTASIQNVGGIPNSNVKAVAVNIMELDETGSPAYLNIINNAQAATNLVDVNGGINDYNDNSTVVAWIGGTSNLLKGQLVGGSAGVADFIVEPMAYMPS